LRRQATRAHANASCFVSEGSNGNHFGQYKEKCAENAKPKAQAEKTHGVQVPEPDVLALLGAGVAAVVTIALIRRRAR
jgi:hypothetical protein